MSRSGFKCLRWERERGGVRESGKREREVWEEREKQWDRENE